MECTENKVPGQAGVRSDACSLEIANFTDHDDVRRLAQDGTQGGRKRHADLRVYLHLVDPGHLIFDRFLYGNDLAVRFVDVIETRVKRSRLAGPRRARDEENAIWQLEQAFEAFLFLRKKSKLRQTELQTGFIEETHDHGFAMIGRNGRDAKVERLLFDLYLDAPILGQAFLCDAHGTSHDLQTAENG